LVVVVVVVVVAVVVVVSALAVKVVVEEVVSLEVGAPAEDESAILPPLTDEDDVLPDPPTADELVALEATPKVSFVDCVELAPLEVLGEEGKLLVFDEFGDVGRDTVETVDWPIEEDPLDAI
jgi:hypothetical protein